MLILTFGWAAMYSSAIACHSALARVVVLDVPPVDGDRLGGRRRRAADAALRPTGPQPTARPPTGRRSRHCCCTRRSPGPARPSIATRRQRVDTSRPPAHHAFSDGPIRRWRGPRLSPAASSLVRRPVRIGRLLLARKFRPRVRLVSLRNHTRGSDGSSRSRSERCGWDRHQRPRYRTMRIRSSRASKLSVHSRPWPIPPSSARPGADDRTTTIATIAAAGRRLGRRPSRR